MPPAQSCTNHHSQRTLTATSTTQLTPKHAWLDTGTGDKKTHPRMARVRRRCPMMVQVLVRAASIEAVDRSNDNAQGRVGGVDYLTIAKVDSHVTATILEDKITVGKLVLARLPATTCLDGANHVIGGAPASIAVHIADKSRAVERVGSCRPVHVGVADECECRGDATTRGNVGAARPTVCVRAAVGA